MSVDVQIDDVFTCGWSTVGIHMPTHEKVYAVRIDIGEWIESQPSFLWQRYDVANPRPCYILSEELLSWMILKWR
jgi:hypothetical protein